MKYTKMAEQYYNGEFELLSLNDKINVNIVESMLSVIDNGNFNFKVLKK